ncbi:uncharacterized protein LOC126260404 [Schistocerca nitens]|uniref:uncharacterized protein LOC126260404 n=1 Tax=Schistocerca nitens TaxID=7011 RepID=UPI00211868A0|nr:uncharacterized protein LOC126260404 [Schistocerca nitens]
MVCVSEWIAVSSEHQELLQKDFEHYFLQLSLEGCQQDHSSQLIFMYFLIKFRVADEALQVLIQFSSPYLCENGFLTLAILKINHHSLLKMEADRRHADEQTETLTLQVVHCGWEIKSCIRSKPQLGTL